MSTNAINITQLEQIQSPKEFAKQLLWTIAKYHEAVQGAFYINTVNQNSTAVARFVEGYAYHIADSDSLEFEHGEGLVGQVMKDGTTIIIDTVPEGYLQVLSGLGNSAPNYLLIFPFKENKNVKAVVELAFFSPIAPGLLQELENYNKIVCEKVKLFNTKQD